MKKIIYLLAMLCIGSAVFAQSYDYDRIPHEPNASKLWFTATLGEQIIPLPSIATYGRIVLFEKEAKVESITIQFQRTVDDQPQLQVLKVLNNDMDADILVQFFLEENGETVVSVKGSEKEYTLSYLIKIQWEDAQGKIHKKYIGKVY